MHSITMTPKQYYTVVSEQVNVDASSRIALERQLNKAIRVLQNGLSDERIATIAGHLISGAPMIGSDQVWRKGLTGAIAKKLQTITTRVRLLKKLRDIERFVTTVEITGDELNDFLLMASDFKQNYAINRD